MPDDAPIPSATTPPRIARRRVHYFSGFDPRGAAWYHRLWKEQLGKRQPSGHALSTGRRERTAHGLHAWTVQWQQAAPAAASAAAADAPAVHTEHVFMAWDDIIRAHWQRAPTGLLREFLDAYATILFTGKLNQARRLSATAVLSGLLPAAFVALSLMLAGLAGVGAQQLIASQVPQDLPAAGGWAGLGGLAAAAAALRACAAWGERAGMTWLMHIFAFVARLGRGPIPDLDARVRGWVEQVIARQQAEPVEEVVLVGHSVGTLVMVDVVDRLLADPRWQTLQAGRRTGMLTLGHCYPFVALVPGAGAFRAALQRLGAHPRLAWLDVTARIDPLCFFEAHPLAGTEVDTRPLPNPVLRSARFFQMYDPRHWAAIRRDKQRTHFLYLMTPDRAGNFDLFDTLYGPRPFASHTTPTARDTP